MPSAQFTHNGSSGTISPWTIDAEEFPHKGTDIEKLRFLLRYAILAPSNHNSQPWAIHIRNGYIELFADRSRSSPNSDPLDRELIISCGAFLGFLRAAAHAFGYSLEIGIFPDPTNEDLLAKISLRNARNCAPDHAVLQAITNRRTNRYAFSSKPLTSEQIQILSIPEHQNKAAVIWLESKEDKASLVRMIMDADKVQFEDPSFLRELASWLRPPATSAADGVQSSSIGISGFAAYVAPLILRTFDMGEGKAARDQGLIKGSAAFAVFTTAFDTPRDWLLCGQALCDFLLRAQQLGLKVSYLNQPCEVGEIRFRLGVLDLVHGIPQLVLRVGCNTITPPPTPRRPVKQLIRSAKN